ncbi:pif6 [Peridroma alphabaculovirus]|uniref:Pif6 n=1 Tax=Peridroma alphabaculovirus TaxID=1346829 RepID=A0A068LMZ0_9ABAC|nr:pif6 [Peridroma alphabaculovirus]AIE47866.1 pif6 [Peridroma alphabaculovirus]
MVRWRLLNTDRIEVSPESREHAWKDLVIDALLDSPTDDTYRTSVSKANLYNFDYNRPLIYEVKNRTILVTSDFLEKCLNQPSGTLSPLNIMPIQVLLAFICAVVLTVVVACQFETTINDDVRR